MRVAHRVMGVWVAGHLLRVRGSTQVQLLYRLEGERLSLWEESAEKRWTMANCDLGRLMEGNEQCNGEVNGGNERCGEE